VCLVSCTCSVFWLSTISLLILSSLQFDFCNVILIKFKESHFWNFSDGIELDLVFVEMFCDFKYVIEHCENFYVSIVILHTSVAHSFSGPTCKSKPTCWPLCLQTSEGETSCRVKLAILWANSTKVPKENLLSRRLSMFLLPRQIATCLVFFF
jgi:hypothetical protein